MRRVILALFACGVMIALMSSCTVRYTTSGASIPPDAKTISVAYFPNRAPLVNPTLSEELTESLKDKFISQTNLQMISDGGDLQFEGEISGYETKPMAVRGDELSALTRLTISVKVRFINLIDPTKDYDTSFSHYEDFDSERSLDEVEAELVPLILEKIIEDIFNRAVVNW